MLKKKWLQVFLSIVMLLSLTSCLIADAVAADNNDKKRPTQFISIASAESGSFQYMYMAAYAGFLRNYMPHINLTTEATSGTSENLDLLFRNEVGIALSSPERLYSAYHGLDSYKDRGKLNGGILWCYMQQSALLATRKDSGIKGFADLAGKKVCIGSAGSSNEIKNAFILDAYGYTRKAPGSFEFNELEAFSISYNEGANALSEGVVDAIVATRPLPDPAIYELALVRPVDIFPLDEDKFQVLRDIYPWMWEGAVPAGVYPGQEALLTLGDPNYVVASLDEVSEEDAYNMTKTYVEKILPQLAEQFAPVQPYAADLSLLTSNWVIPGHPGAVRYFKEIGQDITVATPSKESDSQ